MVSTGVFNMRGKGLWRKTWGTSWNLPDLAKECSRLPAFCLIQQTLNITKPTLSEFGIVWRFSCGTTSQISQDAVNVYDEALAQLLAQKEADSFRSQVQVTIIWHHQFWPQKAITPQQLDRNWKELWWSLMPQMDPNGQVSKDGISYDLVLNLVSLMLNMTTCLRVH